MALQPSPNSIFIALFALNYQTAFEYDMKIALMISTEKTGFFYLPSRCVIEVSDGWVMEAYSTSFAY